jgi:threonine/homoserine/homoserine lactone efflux protein
MIETVLAIPGSTWLAFLLAVWVLNLTPGSDVMFISASGMAGGPRAGVAAGAGVSFGTLFHVTLAALGVASLLAASPAAFAVLRWGGAIYLAYLAWTMWNAPPAERRRGQAKAGKALRRGALNTALNPKVALFVLAFVPQFTDPARGPLWQQFLALGAFHVVASLPVNMSWGLLAGSLAAPMRRFGQTLNRISAAIFAGLAARLVWS